MKGERQRLAPVLLIALFLSVNAQGGEVELDGVDEVFAALEAAAQLTTPEGLDDPLRP